MPCDGVTTTYRDYAHEESLGKLLCEACKLLDANGIKFGGKLKLWWKAHQAHDKRMEKRNREDKKLRAIEKKVEAYRAQLLKEKK